LKRIAPLAPVFASLIASAVFIVLNGYSFGGATQRLPGTSPSSDQVNVLPSVYRYHDASLFTSDFQIQSGAAFKTILWPMVGWACPPEGVPWAFFLLHVASLTAAFFLLWRLAVECCTNASAPSIASAMGGVSMMEGAKAPIIATPPLAAQEMGRPNGETVCGSGPIAGLLAMILIIVVRISPAAEPTLDAAFYTRGAALPFGLAAVLYSLRGRILGPGALLVTAAAIHAITALQVLCVCVPLLLMSPAWPPRRRRFAMAGLALAIAAIVWGIETVMSPAVLRPGEAWIAQQRAVNGSHLFVDLIPQSAWREFAVCGLFLLPALAARAGDPMRRLAGAAIMCAALSVCLGVAGQVSGASVLLQLSPLRGLKLTMILSLVSAAVLVVRSFRDCATSGGSRAARVAAVAGGAALLALVCRQHYAAVAAFALMMAFADVAKWVRVIAIVAAGAIGAGSSASTRRAAGRIRRE